MNSEKLENYVDVYFDKKFSRYNSEIKSNIVKSLNPFDVKLDLDNTDLHEDLHNYIASVESLDNPEFIESDNNIRLFGYYYSASLKMMNNNWVDYASPWVALTKLLCVINKYIKHNVNRYGLENLASSPFIKYESGQLAYILDFSTANLFSDKNSSKLFLHFITAPHKDNNGKIPSVFNIIKDYSRDLRENELFQEFRQNEILEIDRSEEGFLEDIKVFIQTANDLFTSLDVLQGMGGETSSLRNLVKQVDNYYSRAQSDTSIPDDISENKNQMIINDNTEAGIISESTRGQIRSRAEAIKILKEISDFFYTYERTSPITFLVQSAVNVSDWEFSRILENHNAFSALHEALNSGESQ